MTDWTDPRTWTIGELVTKVILDTHVRDNLKHLKEQFATALQVTGRQGGSATIWSTQGTTDYTPTDVKAQVGVKNVTIGTNLGNQIGATLPLYFGSTTVTFPVAFEYAPLVFVSYHDSNVLQVTANASSVTTTGFTISCTSFANTQTFTVAWLAIGDPT